MAKTLCGQYPCPHLCERACHCQAGQERRNRMAGAYAVRRVLRRRVNTATGEISEARPYPKSARFQAMQIVDELWPRDPDVKPAIYGSRTWKPLKSWFFITAFLVFMAIVLLAGLAMNGSSLVPPCEPEPVNYPAYEWQWEK